MKDVNLTDMPEVPEQLASILREKNIVDYKIISVNAAKGRYNLCVSVEDGSPLFVKYNDEKAAGWNSFQKEKQIYCLLKDETYIPRVIYNENILAIEYMENSRTLRELLLYNDDTELFSCLIRDVIEKYRAFLGKLKEYPDVELKTFDADKALNSFLGKLLTSGPYGSKVYKIERFRNKFLNHLLRKGYAARIKLSKKTCAIHGDFHINNILVADRKAYIIDLENVVRGNAAIELAYWYVQIWVLVYQNRNLLSILEKETGSIFDMEMIDEHEFHRIVKLYQMAILLNRRFHRHEKRAAKTILLNKWCELQTAYHNL